MTYDALALISFAKHASYLPTALAGAGLGALAGGGTALSEARREGQSWGDSLRSAGTRAAKGALIGGVAGAGVRAFSPESAEKLQNFGKRTLHSLTGWTPNGAHPSVALPAMGGGTAVNQHWVDEAKEQLSKAVPGAPAHPLLHRLGLSNTDEVAKAQKSLQQMEEGHAAVKALQDDGLTSLPGLAKGFATRPLHTARRSWDATVKGTDGLAKGLLGLGVGGGAYAALRDNPDDPRSRLERGVEFVGNTGLQLATAPLSAVTATRTLTGNFLGMPSAAGASGLMSLPVEEAARAAGKTRYRAPPLGMPHQPLKFQPELPNPLPAPGDPR